MTSANQTRRKLLATGLALPALALTSYAQELRRPAPIPVDVSDVRDVPSLIRAMRKAAGSALPTTLKDEEFHSAFAQIFVQYAHAAADNGYLVPRWVLDRLPMRKVAAPALGFITFPVWGTYFSLSIEAIVKAVLASMALMAALIYIAMNSSEPVARKTI